MRTAGLILALAGLSGAAGMVLAALAAHLTAADGAATGGTMTGGTIAGAGRLVDAALRYHLLHAAALVALAGVAAALGARRHGRPGRGWIWAVAACWLGGTILFSGGLYLRAFAGIASLGPVVPAGGALYILGWAVAAVFGLVMTVRARRG